MCMLCAVGPVDAYFGYLNDPILVIVDQLLLLLGLPNDTWSTAVPGITANYTSESDTARRNNPLVQKTGKDNSAEIGRIVTYNGMPDQWVCVSTGDSQDPGKRKDLAVASLSSDRTVSTNCLHVAL